VLSIVIPTLNESAAIRETIDRARGATNGAEVEFVVADCDSRDDTSGVAARAGAAVISGGCCRACAMNRGAGVSCGDVLLFLHADTELPTGFASLVSDAIAHRGWVGGAFDFSFATRPDEAPGVLARHLLDLVVLCNRIRFRWTGNFYGDQCIFVRRDVFDRIGGFPHVRLMEDVRFSRRLRHFGRTGILRPPVRTSPRRFVTRGVVRQFANDLALLGLDALGLEPTRRWNHYNGWNRRTQR
jgi:rSAM/selenodomain-associated transferase 2